MKRMDLVPKVSVYRDYIPNVDEILSFLKKTKDEKNKDSFINEWKTWSETGLVSIGNDIISFDPNNVNEIYKKEYNMLIELTHSIRRIAQEYIDQWKNIDYWKFDFDPNNIIKDWLMTDNNYLVNYAPFDYLMHGVTKPEDRLAMSYHTDAHQFDTESKKVHHLFTIIAYLNDDYEDGEVSFYDENNFTINYYKPKKGDVVVFPSFYPYFHAVEPITNGQKFILRTFALHNYEGSKKWNRLYEKLGTRWLNIEASRIEKEWNNPNYFRIPVFEDDSEDFIESIHCTMGNVIPFPYTRKQFKEKFTIKWEN
jgi:hypothetical protein